MNFRAKGFTPPEAAVIAGYTRLRPIIMTACAMIIGMLPMPLGIGEGGEQNAIGPRSHRRTYRRYVCHSVLCSLDVHLDSWKKRQHARGDSMTQQTETISTERIRTRSSAMLVRITAAVTLLFALVAIGALPRLMCFCSNSYR